MNRRSFFTKLGLAAATVAVLPSATTYARRWVKPAVSPIYVLNPAWVNAPYEMVFFTPLFKEDRGKVEWKRILEDRSNPLFPKDALVAHDLFPIRFKSIEDKDAGIDIPAFINIARLT